MTLPIGPASAAPSSTDAPAAPGLPAEVGTAGPAVAAGEAVPACAPKPTTTTALTLVQKLLARAAGAERVAVGERVHCRIDGVLLDQSASAWPLAPMLRQVGAGFWDRQRIVLVLDAPAAGGTAAAGGVAGGAAFDAGDDWRGLPYVYAGLGDAARVQVQAGHVRPGMLTLTADARSALGGAFGALTYAADAHAMLRALGAGAIRLQVPETVFMRWTGRLADGVGAHDMALHLRARLGPRGAAQAVLEFGGEAVAALDMDGRMTLVAASPGLGASAGLVAPDRSTWLWLHDAGLTLDDAALAPWRSDEDAAGIRHSFDASSLPPQVALAPATGDAVQVRALDDLDPIAIDVAVLGGADGAKFEDLRAAARVLAGYRIAPGVQLLVAPASRLDRELAAREGILRWLVEAGATLLPGHRVEGTAAADSTVITSCTRPARITRPGTAARAAAPLLCASPFTVAASALRGRVSDAREVLA